MKEVQVWIATFHITEDIDVLTIVHSMVGVIWMGVVLILDSVIVLKHMLVVIQDGLDWLAMKPQI